jgi:ribose transport system substrate-binding protein
LGFHAGGEDSVLRRLTMATAALLPALGQAALAAESPPRTVVLAVAPVGNTWRTAMLQSWQRVAEDAIRDRLVAAAPVKVATANSIAAEAAQLAALIAEHPAAIVLDAGSPQALNSVVRQACDAGIVVVSFDGIVTEPCAYRLQVDFSKLGAIEMDYLATRLPAGGNLLEVRGVSNTDVDDAIHAGMAEAVAAHPSLHIVGAVHGNWRRSNAKRNTDDVLSVLPEIDGVVTQGGDGLGTADAFTEAGRALPIVILSNRADELAWWKAGRDAGGYQTLSVAPSPGIASLAFWIAQMILDGKDVPHDMTAPFLTVEAADLDAALAATPAGGFFSRDATKAEAEAVVAASR